MGGCTNNHHLVGHGRYRLKNPSSWVCGSHYDSLLPSLVWIKAGICSEVQQLNNSYGSGQERHFGRPEHGGSLAKCDLGFVHRG
jgi:hypothetical protein